MCGAKGHVRFTSNSDHESGLPYSVMSALPPKADMCSATRYVRFVPIADSCTAAKCRYSITSSASTRSAGGIASPSAVAALALITSNTLRTTAEMCEQLRTEVWLGRQDSNLGMAESKLPTPARWWSSPLPVGRAAKIPVVARCLSAQARPRAELRVARFAPTPAL
jgi:hypothetical protein